MKSPIDTACIAKCGEPIKAGDDVRITRSANAVSSYIDTRPALERLAHVGDCANKMDTWRAKPRKKLPKRAW